MMDMGGMQGGMGMMQNGMMANMNGSMNVAGGMNMDPNTMNAMIANHGGYMVQTQPGALGGVNSFLGSLLNFSIDILAILVVVGLILAAVVFIKRYIFADFDLGVTQQPVALAPEKTPTTPTV